jgi:squalene-associated FAD-dependent desaturase
MTIGGRNIGVVGGGLAGLAAAAALIERGFRVELFEAKRNLGGRAGSFVDPATGELVDRCQHVAMGCCSEFLEFIRRTGVEHLFRCDQTLHFFSPSGKQFDLRASRWLPAPLHLMPAMVQLDYLTWREKFGIARALRRLMRYRELETANQASIGQWLREQGQSPRAIERFWQIVLVSALGEELDRASIAAARRVFLDGFLATRAGYHIYAPRAPLGAIYEQGIGPWLSEHGARVFLEQKVGLHRVAAGLVTGLRMPDGSLRPFDAIIVAIGWKDISTLFPRDEFPELGATVAHAASLTSSPITSLHLLFDREITPLPHAVFINRLSQWVFRQSMSGDVDERAIGKLVADFGFTGPRLYGYQVVISASRSLAGRERGDVLREVLDDLQTVFSPAREANLIHWRMLTQHDAVFSYRPGLDAIRPTQRTPIENLFLAGDWTATGWPSTMESAVRSGNLAAAAVAASPVVRC